MTANQMRQAVATLYSINFVAKLTDAQIIAIYMRLKKKGKVA